MSDSNRKRLYMLEGANIGFRALKEADVEGNWFKWFNDPEVTKYLGHGAFPNTREAQMRFYRDNAVSSPNQVIFAAEDKATRTHIGVASVRNINWINRSGEIAIIIGEKAFRTGNNALETFYLITKYSFMTLNLHRLATVTMADNIVSLEYCKRIGFKDIGVAREMCYKDGSYMDCVYADLLREEWLKSEGIDADRESERSDERVQVQRA